jgi:hypothetical protein
LPEGHVTGFRRLAANWGPLYLAGAYCVVGAGFYLLAGDLKAFHWVYGLLWLALGIGLLLRWTLALLPALFLWPVLHVISIVVQYSAGYWWGARDAQGFMVDVRLYEGTGLLGDVTLLFQPPAAWLLTEIGSLYGMGGLGELYFQIVVFVVHAMMFYPVASLIGFLKVFDNDWIHYFLLVIQTLLVWWFFAEYGSHGIGAAKPGLALGIGLLFGHKILLIPNLFLWVHTTVKSLEDEACQASMLNKAEEEDGEMSP